MKTRCEAQATDMQFIYSFAEHCMHGNARQIASCCPLFPASASLLQVALKQSLHDIEEFNTSAPSSRG